ncbi:hypothetical protein ABBQ32_006948 [Trebouxia sp. C0010 RCD-2024]
MDDDEATSSSLIAYYDLLRDNRAFTVVWLGEIIDNVGNWLNYVATLSLVEQLAGGQGLLISALIIVRFLPSFLMFPLAGVVADRVDRPKVMLFSTVVNIFIVLGLTIIKRPQDIWGMYVLIFLQFASSTFYDPARRALEPLLVPKRQLHLATTLDTFAWSVTVALGSSIGGAVVSKLGTTMCFVLDSCTFICAAICALILQIIIKKDGYANQPETKRADESEELLAPLDEPVPSNTIPELSSMSQVLAPNSIDAEMQSVSLHTPQSPAAGDDGPKHAEEDENSDPNQAASTRRNASDVELQPLQKKNSASLEDTSCRRRQSYDQECNPLVSSASAQSLLERKNSSEGTSSSTAGCLGLVQEGFAEGIVSLKEAAAYISQRDNREVGVLCLVKFSGALVWGAADVLQVKYSAMPSMQTLGDSSQTLGFVFAAVGVGCFFGPIFFNFFTPPRKPQLLRSTAASFYCFVLGYLLLILANNISLLLMSTAIRSAGSAVLWIYSTLMLQYLVPNQLLGRIMALEMALFTVADASSAVFGGAAFDLLHLHARQVSSVMLGVAVLPTMSEESDNILGTKQQQA